MNWRAVKAIYKFEMARTGRTLAQSIVSPVISTVLYFVVFGSAIGSRITEVEGVSYGSFIVPGLIMLSVLTQSIANAKLGMVTQKNLLNMGIRSLIVNPNISPKRRVGTTTGVA